MAAECAQRAANGRPATPVGVERTVRTGGGGWGQWLRAATAAREATSSPEERRNVEWNIVKLTDRGGMGEKLDADAAVGQNMGHSAVLQRLGRRTWGRIRADSKKRGSFQCASAPAQTAAFQLSHGLPGGPMRSVECSRMSLSGSKSSGDGRSNPVREVVASPIPACISESSGDAALLIIRDRRLAHTDPEPPELVECE
eukprot:CAMPEP_0119388078 /NCGR_PEP_ID=MMETSP1334-20130426/103471_1 /TAXON_ID=127549 /ORGANISM="Calcidiscus leptoporus, Strain RCC1130" /LENGTH=198 /DNA_ID=CAMNT_0007409961 /DNA_START=121 /DNA_END=715 /DNA_ORIENTATION=+